MGKGQPYRSIYRIVCDHASHDPDKTALIEKGTSYCYADLAEKAGQFCAHLAIRDLKPKALVAIEWQDLFTHLAWSMACEEMGYVSLCFVTRADTISTPLKADLYIFMTRCPSGFELPHIMSSKVGDAGLPSLPDIPLPPDHPLRIFETSGTTGLPKFILRTVRQHVFRHGQSLARMSYDGDTRYLLLYDFRLQECFSSTMSVLRAGGICVYDPACPSTLAIARYDITHMSFVLSNLLNMMHALGEDFVKRPRLKAHIIGGSVAPDLRTQVRARLTDDFIESYGTNEVGIIAAMNDDGIGHLLPNIKVEVVDAHDQPQPVGTPGVFRIKSEGCVTQYLANPDASAKYFKDGWFYPGDMAVLLDDQRFKILGRIDDLINVDGIKTLPGPLEAMLEKEEAIKEACIVAGAGREGHSKVFICVVAASGQQIKPVIPTIRKTLPAHWQQIAIVEMPELPKTETGKIQRHQVREKIRNGLQG